MPDIFLSYSREDQAIARQFATGLERAGFSVWWDQALTPGEAFDQVTEQALEQAKAVVVLWSRTSVQSRWVRAEATQAAAANRLVPVMIEPCKRPIMFELTHTADLEGWAGDEGDARWRAFVQGLARMARSGHEPAAAGSTATARAATPPPRGTRRPGTVAIASAILALLFAAGLGWYFRSGDPRPPDATTGAGASIVVLPFDEVGAGIADLGYGVGVANAIRDLLDRVPGMAVTPQVSSVAIKPRAADLQDVRRTLNVTHMLEGTVSGDEKDLSVSVRLVNLETGTGSWSRSYDAANASILSIQKDIAAQVVDALQVRLGVGIGETPGMTRDVEAYYLYMQAASLSSTLTPDAWRRAMTLAEQAVARDRDFAQAWRLLHGVANSLPLLLDMQDRLAEAAQFERKAAQAVEEYRRLMQGTPELEDFIGGIERLNGNLVEAQQRFLNARELAIDAGRHESFVGDGPPDFLMYVGRVSEAIPTLEKFRARDSLNPAIAQGLGQAYSYSGQRDAAAGQMTEAIRLSGGTDVGIYGRAIASALGMRDVDRARRLLQQSLEDVPGHPAREYTERMLELLDRPAEALSYIRQFLDRPGTNQLNVGASSYYFAYHGDPQGVLDYCGKFGRGCLSLIDLWDPGFRELRQLPDTHRLMREAGLVDYWREFGAGDFCKPTAPDWSSFECR